MPQLSQESLTPHVEALEREFDAIHRDVRADLGASDEVYIRRLVSIQRVLNSGGRGLLLVARFPAAFAGGTTLLALAKILDNMEIGHGERHRP